VCYAGASTLQDFFCALKASLPSEEYCRLVGQWVDKLMDRLLDSMHHKEWCVPSSGFQCVDIQVCRSLAEGSDARSAKIEALKKSV
jgi:hypothetical protein